MAAKFVPWSHPVNELASLRAQARHLEGTIAYLRGEYDRLEKEKEALDEKKHLLSRQQIKVLDTGKSEATLLRALRAQIADLERRAAAHPGFSGRA